MGFAEDKVMDYLRDNLSHLEIIKINELLLHLTGCLSMSTVEKLDAYVRNQGNRPSVLSFYIDLSKCDNWVTHFINALKKCGHVQLAEELETVYSSYQLPTSRHSSPQSLPPSSNHYNRQPPLENPHRRSSLPASPDKQPSPSSKTSQSFNQTQPEQETSRGSSPQQNHEFRSLPPFRPNLPSPPRAPLSHDVSASSGKTLDEETSGNPVPESTPYQPAPSESLEKDESWISENPHIGPDPLPNRSLSPQSEVSIQPSSEDGSLVKVSETRTTPSYSPSISSEGADQLRGQPVRNKTKKLPEQDSVYMTVTPGQKDRGGKEQQREQSVIHKAAHPPEQMAPKDRSVLEKVVARGQRNGQSSYQAVEDIPDSRPIRCHPANRGTTEEEPRRERSANPQVLPGSSCRPLDNNNDYDEECVSKPGVLVSTERFGDVSIGGGVSSVMTHIPVLEISDCTERNESSNVSDRSSPSIAQDRFPPVSTPNTRSMQIEDKRSPEENDFTFDMKSSPQRRRPLDQSSSKQPEQNSFGSRDVSHFRLDFNEGPEEDLMRGNDDVLRNRPRKIISTSEPNYENIQQEHRKEEEGRDRERMVLVTITVASLCLSLYLLWKSRQN